MEGNTDKVDISQVNIKTLESMETALDGWFSIVEAQLNFRNVSTNNKILRGDSIASSN